MNSLPEINGQIQIQTVSATLTNGMVITAAVDLWVATLLEVVDDDLRTAWLQKMVSKIQEQHTQPRIVRPNGVVFQ